MCVRFLAYKTYPNLTGWDFFCPLIFYLFTFFLLRNIFKWFNKF